MSSRGQRVLAAASANEQRLHFVGLLGLEDGVRADSRSVVQAIRASGVRVVMITGDNVLTARNVAEQVDIPPKILPGRKAQRKSSG